MQNPLISIIIPNYNRADLINDTLQSIAVQSYSNWEAIVVDDGSTDESEKVARNFIKDDSRFKFYRRDRLPKGAPTCRNIGLENATGDFIIFLDSDDILAPWCIEERVKRMRERPADDFAVFPILIFSETVGDSRIRWNQLNEGNDLERFIRLDLPWVTGSVIWKKESVRNINGWSEGFFNWQDWDLHLRALAAPLTYSKYEVLPDCFMRRNIKVARISAQKPSTIQMESRLELFSRNFELLKAKGLADTKTKETFAGHFLLMGEQICLYQLPIGRKKVTKIISGYQLLNNKQLKLVTFYLDFFNTFTRNRIVWLRSFVYKAVRLFLPDNVVRRKSTHLKLELSKDSFDNLMKKIDTHKSFQKIFL